MDIIKIRKNLISLRLSNGTSWAYEFNAASGNDINSGAKRAYKQLRLDRWHLSINESPFGGLELHVENPASKNDWCSVTNAPRQPLNIDENGTIKNHLNKKYETYPELFERCRRVAGHVEGLSSLGQWVADDVPSKPKTGKLTLVK